jgi:hypothetical protein
MEGLRPAIELIQETACKAEAAQVLNIQDPDNYHIRLGDKIMTIARPAESRQHRVYDVPSFCATVDTFEETACSVWHSHGQIVAILGDATRRDRVTLGLDESAQLMALRDYDGKPLDQRSFCSMLKLRLDIPETFVGQFRRLDWRHEKEASGTADRGKDRMGISISDEVNGVADLADSLVLEIPIYDLANLPYRYKIACHIEIDAAQQKLAVVSKPDAIKTAVDQAQFDIGKLLDNGLNKNDSESTRPIFYGTP